MFADGEKYEGEFRNGLFEGHGVYFWVSGKRYEGMWEKNLMNGMGMTVWPDGRKLISFNNL